MTVHFPFQNTYAALPASFFARVTPTPVASPRLIKLNWPLAVQLGLDPDLLDSPEGAEILAGKRIPDGADPIAMAYAGHQFGHFVPQLGDGRAILLGEVIDAEGVRRDIQLKGSGPTPFSRRGDGRAALGPVLREYIVSEAMAALGIPTTRSLAAVITGENVMRETPLPGAVLTRVASSHIRVGTFQYFAARSDTEGVRRLADHVIARHYPHAADAERPYRELLEAVIARQADLVARWLLVGFIHGVMNTDNSSVAGETIDYGPCAFMDRYALDTVFSSIDRRGRYAYGNQPRIAQWNLARLTEALLPLIDVNEARAIERAQAAIAAFDALFNEAWLAGMRRKLGLENAETEDHALVQALTLWMQQAGADYTCTFRDLVADAPPTAEIHQDRAFLDWHARWSVRRARQPGGPDDAFDLMRASNPVVVPRNHKVEEALFAAGDGDLQPFLALLDAVRDPFTPTPTNDDYRDPPVNPDPGYRTFCGT